MAYIISYLIMFAPPILCGYLYYRHEKKKQAHAPQPNYIMLYLVPFVIATIANILWSVALYGFAYLFMQA